MSLPVKVDSIPDEMKALKNWVLWKYTDRKNSNGEIKKTKEPYQVNGKKAESDNPDTWESIENVIKTLKRYPDKYNGIGFMFSKDSGIMGLDFDHIRDPVNGKWDTEAIEEIKSLNSYAELSPSGTGAHVICYAGIPGKHRREGPREMYEAGRYFTVTGDHIEGTYNKIGYSQGAVKALYHKWFDHRGEEEGKLGKQPENKGNKENSSTEKKKDMNKQELLRKASDKGEKFTDLFFKGHQTCIKKYNYPSDSEVDQALFTLLASITTDAELIKEVFKESALYRSAKGEKYLNRSIEGALSYIDRSAGEKEKPVRDYRDFELYNYGVYYVKTDSKGNTTRFRIIDEQTEIVGTSDNLDVDLEDNEVNKFTHYKLRTGDITLYPEHGELLTKAGIVKLIKAGMIASEGDYKHISTYFKHEMVRAKRECEKLKVCNKPGWKRNKSVFVSGNFAYSDNGAVEVILTNPITGQMYKKKGTLEDWLKPELIEWLDNNVARFVFYTAFTCFISSYLGVQNIIVSFTGGTSGGKTLTASIAGSGMGKTGIDDKGESIVRAATITQAAAEYLSVSVNGHYIVFDDTTQGKDYSGLVYMLSNGRKKDRAPNSSLEGGEVYSASYVITGEQGLLKDSVTQGANGRVIEIKNTIESNVENAKKAKIIEDTIKENYGHLTEPFLKKVFERKEVIQKKYFELCDKFRDEEKDIGGRIGDQMACICIAGDIIEEIFSEIGIPAKVPYEICEEVVYSNTTSEQKREYWLRGLEIVYNEVSTWTQEKDADGALTQVLRCGKGIGGNYTGGWLNILESNIKDICDKHHLNKKELIEKWAEKGATRTDKPGKDGKPKFSKAVTIEGQTKKTISLDIQKVLELLDITTEETGGRRTGLTPINEAIFQEHVKNISKAWKNLYERQPQEGEEGDFCKLFFETFPQHKDCYSNMQVVLEAGKNFTE